MLTFGSRTKFWLILSAAITVVLIFALLYFYVARLVREDWLVLVRTKSGLNRIENVRSEVTDALRRLTRMSDEKKAIESSFASAGDPLSLIEAVENTGRSLGVKTELGLGEGSGSAGGQYALRASGGFGAVMAFLKSVESLPFLVKIGNVEMYAAGVEVGGSKQGGGEPHVVIKIDFQIVAP